MKPLEQIAFLRGVNLGKLNKVPMKDLATYLSDIGIEQIKTLLASGNVYLKNNPYSAQELEEHLSKRYGFSIPVFLRTKEELQELYHHPMLLESTAMVLFLEVIPTSKQLQMLSETITDRYIVIANYIIIVHSESYHKTKFTNNYFERILAMRCSIRNKNTIAKIFSLFDED